MANDGPDGSLPIPSHPPPIPSQSDPSGGSTAPPAPTPATKAKPKAPSEVSGPPAAAKPEGPEGVAWRVWLALYRASHYRRGYSRSPGDGTVIKALAKSAAQQLVDDGRPASDLEALLTHQFAAYLRDTGSKDFVLRDKGHGLRWLAHGLPTYGTPWARAPRPAPRLVDGPPASATPAPAPPLVGDVPPPPEFMAALANIGGGGVQPRGMSPQARSLLIRAQAAELIEREEREAAE